MRRSRARRSPPRPQPAPASCAPSAALRTHARDLLGQPLRQQRQKLLGRAGFAGERGLRIGAVDLLPRDVAGLIRADDWFGEIVAMAPDRPLAAARRKALTLRFARLAAQRLVLPLLAPDTGLPPQSEEPSP